MHRTSSQGGARKAIAIAAAAVTVAIALGGCSASGASTATSTPSGPSKLIFSPNTAPTTLDIDTVDDRSTTALLAPDVYEGLTHETYDKSGKLEWVPSLATKWKQIAPDQWRFTIRPGVKFDDGHKLTAKDVVYSINRRLLPSSAATVTLAKIVKAVQVNTMEVDVYSNGPDLYVYRAVYAIPITPYNWGTTNKAAAAVTADGTGPYTLASYGSGGDTAVLKKNPNYWGTPAKIDEVDMNVIPDAASALSALQTGETNVVLNLTPDLAATAPATLHTDSVQPFLGRIGASNPVFNNVKVRQALNMAIDQKSLIKNIFLGKASAAHGQIAPSTALGFNPNVKDFPYNPSDAKKLISQAGATGATLNLMCSKDRYGTAGSDLCQAIAEMWNKVGLKVNLEYPPAAQWLSNGLYASQNKVTPPDVFIVGSGTNDFDASTTLLSWLTCGVAKNVYCNPSLQNQITQASQMTNSAAREKALEAAAVSVDTNVPFVWLPLPQNIWGVSKNVKGVMYPIAEDVRWADWSITN
ncbi:MAG: peptide/nickel transport system substrate-binding protein [Actinomycetota bacterium]|jgi:peptide/nickel transport system substrate-binding protein|nr:peptide/nickel transport system substrate-binding protein [Actinomycetota bacterium]